MGAVFTALLWVWGYRRRERQLREAIVYQLRRGPAYGLQLTTNLEMSLGKRPSAGLLYPTLRAMEREGTLVSENRCEAVDARGGRPRRYYWLADDELD